jgi:ornithine cyclodeaminase
MLPAPRFYDEATVKTLLDPVALIDAIEHTLIDYSTGRMINPLRTVAEVPAAPSAGEHPATGGLLFIKPVITPDHIVTKLITQMAGNAARGLPTLLASLTVLDRATGALLGVMEATWLTNLRTAAVSAVAVRKLTPQRPLVVALIGAGALARTHALALPLVRGISQMRIWSRSPANVSACAAEIADLQGMACTAIVCCESAQQAVTGADVVITVTLASEPVVLGAWLKPGALVCAVGAPRPTWRELDDAAMHAGDVIADSYDSARNEAGDVKLSGAPVVAEIGELLAGSKNLVPGRTVVFKALGLAAEDAAAAKLVLAAAQARSPR